MLGNLFTQELPEGRRGQVLAVLIGLLVLVLLWILVASPLMNRYESRSEEIDLRRTYLERTRALAVSLPALQAQSGQAGGGRKAVVDLLQGGEDALAAAELQQAVQAMAAQQRVTVASLATVNAVPLGPFRRIGVRIAFQTEFEDWARMLAALAEGAPTMIVDEMELHSLRSATAPSESGRLRGGAVIYAFRAAASNDENGSSPRGGAGPGTASP